MSENITRGFKRKTIAKTIRHKLNKWVESIEDEKLRAEILDDCIVTGGAITSMLLGQNPNDYDVYFKSKSVAKKVAEHYLKAYLGHETMKVSKIEVMDTSDGQGVAVFVKSSGIIEAGTDLAGYDYFESLSPNTMTKYFDEAAEKAKAEKAKYRPLMISSNAITLSDDIQIILRFCGDPETIHQFYDFVHCTNYYTKASGVVLKADAMEATLTRELKYVGSKFPLCSMFRLKKFIKRGWTITAGDMLKIGWDMNQLKLDNPEVLREQLIGMDAAYFHQVLRMLKDKGFGDPGVELDRTYLFECIERVFDQDSDTPDHDDE
jgi:hypothetical protein